MKHILQIMRGLDFECLACEPVNLDIERFSEYRDSEEHPAAEVFEIPKPSTAKKRVDQLDSSMLKAALMGHFTPSQEKSKPRP